MKEEKNGYAQTEKVTHMKKLKKQITIRVDADTLDYFKEQAEISGIPYQTLINLHLSDCARKKKKLQVTWE